MRSHSVLPLLGGLLLGGCAAAVTPVVAVPGPGKEAAVFQKDDAACRTQAATQGSQPAGGTMAQWRRYFTSYADCAVAHGDRIQPVPWAAAGVGYGYPYTYAIGAYPYPYPYAPYPYAMPYPVAPVF